MSILVFLIAAFAAVVPQSAWSDSKNPVPSKTSCPELFVATGPQKRIHIFKTPDGERHKFRRGTNVILELAQDDHGLPNPVRGQVTGVYEDGVVVNDCCYVRWDNIKSENLFVSNQERPQLFFALQSHIQESLDRRADILAGDEIKDRWSPALLAIYNDIRFWVGMGVVVQADDIKAALEILIDVSATPGGQAYVDLFESQFWLTSPEGLRRWSDVFGKTDLSQKGLHKLELLMSSFEMATDRPQ